MELEDSRRLKIGELAHKAGVPAKRIRYYEERGLLTPSHRTEAGYRLYTDREVAQLQFISRAKRLGLTLNEIQELVALASECNDGHFFERLEFVLEDKLEQTERKLRELSEFHEKLLSYRSRAASLDYEQARKECESARFCNCLESLTREEVRAEDDKR